MNNRDKQIIIKILLEIEVIEQLIAGLDALDFIADERTKRAVCMTLINIGELVKNLTYNFKAATTSVPWKSIAGMRDITAHKYQTLKMGDVWQTVKHDIPVLKAQLASLIK
ncbi:HepT-like ribonuclease domain-containing protein [Phosphitispora fastidiosa]|uniref:HepT-like ribonuclease domain-containing protein n=1 Tax=Phosphitispora fastidiosa TaxID=2837202 RepID=UPI001E618136|nr:HepT-like ribonuclease domain-containing protein [Phosphitispora fastidiosa]MBU7008237.1 hypothetical protein [Phosphitispora fastidiosa]